MTCYLLLVTCYLKLKIVFGVWWMVYGEIYEYFYNHQAAEHHY